MAQTVGTAKLISIERTNRIVISFIYFIKNNFLLF